jgi:hypothetical protein
LTIGLFASVGRWAWRDSSRRNRPATVGLVCSGLGVASVAAAAIAVGIIAFAIGASIWTFGEELGI